MTELGAKSQVQERVNRVFVNRNKPNSKHSEVTCIDVVLVVILVGIPSVLQKSRPAARYCNGKDNFVSVCKTKQKKAEINQVQEGQTSEHQPDYTFRVTSGVEPNVFTVSVGGGWSQMCSPCLWRV